MWQDPRATLDRIAVLSDVHGTRGPSGSSSCADDVEAEIEVAHRLATATADVREVELRTGVCRGLSARAEEA